MSRAGMGGFISTLVGMARSSTQTDPPPVARNDSIWNRQGHNLHGGGADAVQAVPRECCCGGANPSRSLRC